ncbi:MAG: hypothetical protein JSU87_14975 [Gemmatimonadota bacterium]|nr:MAG: hypothetical protein JSU87_14975 [Gemmatimonadota bacterium]
MNASNALAAWLDLRPGEGRKVALSFLGAFLVLGFLTVARSLRDALFLEEFDITALPYVIAAVAMLSIPTVGIFSRTLTKYPPKRVLKVVLVVLAAGLAFLLPFASGPGFAPGLRVPVVIFYLWTAIGTLLITSGFWVVTSEQFPVRGAKRLYGLIGAGGTAGALLMGTSLVWLTPGLDMSWLIAGMILLIVLLYATQRFLPELDEPAQVIDESTSLLESLSAVWKSPHLRTTALIVGVVGVATTFLDYQFKELAQDRFTEEGLASFFGAFYGWTSAIALLLQVLVVGRLLAAAGVAWSLTLLPLLLLTGSAGMLVAPSLILVTLVKGGDASLRKSIYRSALEFVYVPIPSLLRRKTKTFVDSVVDSVAEGVGAGIIFLLVTLSGFDSLYLSAFIIVLSLILVSLSRRMGKQYFHTVTEQLQASGERAETYAARTRLEERDLLSSTFTRLDLSALVSTRLPQVQPDEQTASPGDAAQAVQVDAVAARLNSPDLATVARALDEASEWQEEHIPALGRLLARDPVFDRTVAALLSAGTIAVPHLAGLLRDEATDFVIRRRIPRVLARMGDAEADDALIDALSANRFEVRYRAAIALVRRRRHGLPRPERDVEGAIWEAIRSEVGRGRPVWEMQRLLDGEEDEADRLVAKRLGTRGELSLEHTFRLLSLVLEPEPVRAAFHGVILDDEKLRSFALEYLEQVLPADVRGHLWPFIGDISDQQRAKSIRPLDDVVSDLMTTGATLFAAPEDREALKRLLEGQDE